MFDNEIDPNSILAYLIVSSLFGALFWPYTIDTWFEFFGKPVNFPWWAGSLLNTDRRILYMCFPLALITWGITLVV